MGLKGIFLAILIIYTIYLWWRVRKKAQKKSHKLVHWVLGGIAVYYGISTLIMIIGSD
jgi:cytochrome c oxidase assembly factor CtaG